MNASPRYNPDVHHRRSIRLLGYDYSQAGAYFITLCTHNRECLFGRITDGEMRLNEYGKIVRSIWNDLVNHVGHIELGEFTVMPNHIHGIIVLVGAGSEPAPTTKRHALPEIVRQLKTFSARRVNDQRQTPGVPVWQRNYYEHIIRHEKSYHDISTYILNNPAKWETDELYSGGNP